MVSASTGNGPILRIKMPPQDMERIEGARMTLNESATAELLGPLNDLESKNAPARLYWRGRAELLRNTVRVSIVGTRSPSDEGRLHACRLAGYLVDNGVAVVSGLAKGIDYAAHTTAIDRGGVTIAVIGVPIDRVYPAAHRQLQERIGAEHLLLSQFAPGERTFPSSFPRRNRTMALISHATVVIEAGESSGTESQAWEAIRLGRPLFLLPALVESGAEWARQVVDHGAEILNRPSDVLDYVPFPGLGDRAYAL